MPLNVLFVVPYAPTRIRTRSYHFIRALASLGHRVTVPTVWSTSEERATVEAASSNGAPAVLAERLPRTRTVWNCMHACCNYHEEIAEQRLLQTIMSINLFSTETTAIYIHIIKDSVPKDHDKNYSDKIEDDRETAPDVKNKTQAGEEFCGRLSDSNGWQQNIRNYIVL